MRTGKFKVAKRLDMFGHYYWWFTLSATNGNVIAASEMYTTKRACINGIKSVIKNAATATIEVP